MSDRGSFVTEYIYCDKCFDAVRKVLIGNEKYLQSVEIPHWDKGRTPLPIIAGKIGGLYSREELDTFRDRFIPAIEKLICHEVRIAVLAEDGEEIFTAVPIADHPKQYKGDFEKSKE